MVQMHILHAVLVNCRSVGVSDLLLLKTQRRNGFAFVFLSVCLVLGFIQEDYLRELLTTMGDRFTDEEVDELYREAPIDKKGNFNYIEFTRILKHGAKDKDD